MATPGSDAMGQYLIITGNYWAFTLTDGALRMLVVLHFHTLGYSALEIALLFLFYEVFGVVTNLVGGWLGARWGLNRTMNLGLALQVLALAMLLAPTLTVPWVMAAQALSGIAKDLNKMSAKSAMKFMAGAHAQHQLYRRVALLTGSKNALKGLGFFLGALLLSLWSFHTALWAMGLMLLGVWLLSLALLHKDLGRSATKPKFREVFSSSPAINWLSAARLFLFASRDVWFVVALPVYLSSAYGWDHWEVGGFLALWIMAYGAVQSLAPWFTGKAAGKLPDGGSVALWTLCLAIFPLIVWACLAEPWLLVAGLLAFGFVFAINSSLHSYLIVSYARAEGVSLDVGFYYMANALGRLLGTVLSGWLFTLGGLELCLWLSTALVAAAALISLGLPRQRPDKAVSLRP